MVSIYKNIIIFYLTVARTLATSQVLKVQMLSKVHVVFYTHSINLILLKVKDIFPASDMVCCVYARYRMNNSMDTSLHLRVRKCHNAYQIISF